MDGRRAAPASRRRFLANVRLQYLVPTCGEAFRRNDDARMGLRRRISRCRTGCLGTGDERSVARSVALLDRTLPPRGPGADSRRGHRRHAADRTDAEPSRAWRSESAPDRVDRWGHDVDPHGKVVWADIAV